MIPARAPIEAVGRVVEEIEERVERGRLEVNILGCKGAMEGI